MTETPQPPGGGQDGDQPAGQAGAQPGDTVGYGADAAPGAPARGGRRGLVIGAGAAALAVVAGAAIWATTTLSGGGRQPDELVPKTTFAYLKVDLDPAAGQKLAARELFAKFPKLKDKARDEDSVFDDVLSDLLAGEDLDYAADVRPWFDKRAAVAAFPGGRGAKAPHVVAVLRSKDDGKAKASLDRAVAEAKAEGDDVAYRLVKGYAVVGDTAAVADAVRLAEDASLRDNGTYRADVERLDGDQVAVAWADLGRAFDVAKGMLPLQLALPIGLGDAATGRVVAGVHLTGDYVEVQGRLLDVDRRAVTPGGDHALLTGLPASTAAAVSVNGLGKAAKEGGGATLGMLLRRYLQGSGVTTEDIFGVLGDEAVVAAEDVKGLASLRAGLVSKVADPGKAATTAEKANALFGVLGIPVAATVDSGRFVIATPADYSAALADGGGGLGESPRFTAAVGDLKGASAAAYVDLRALRAAFPGFVSADFDALTSFGAVSGFTGDEGFFRLRVVAG